VAWRSGNVLSEINEVALRRARLVLGWVTVHGRSNQSAIFRQMVKWVLAAVIAIARKETAKGFVARTAGILAIRSTWVLC